MFITKLIIQAMNISPSFIKNIKIKYLWSEYFKDELKQD
jgi:hypothetical protein